MLEFEVFYHKFASMGKISKDIIQKAFEGDNEIGLYCDPSIAGATPDEVSLDVFNKLNEIEGVYNGTFKEYQKDGQPVGFCYLIGSVLISFGINKSHRNSDNLCSFYNFMKSDGLSSAFLWERNTRAIKWLEKCGMEVEERLNGVVKLKNEEVCQ
jgi:hypothetical protein